MYSLANTGTATSVDANQVAAAIWSGWGAPLALTDAAGDGEGCENESCEGGCNSDGLHDVGGCRTCLKMFLECKLGLGAKVKAGGVCFYR